MKQWYEQKTRDAPRLSKEAAERAVADFLRRGGAIERFPPGATGFKEDEEFPGEAKKRFRNFGNNRDKGESV